MESKAAGLCTDEAVIIACIQAVSVKLAQTLMGINDRKGWGARTLAVSCHMFASSGLLYLSMGVSIDKLLLTIITQHCPAGTQTKCLSRDGERQHSSGKLISHI